MWKKFSEAQAGVIDLGEEDTRLVYGGTRGGDADLEGTFDGNDFNSFYGTRETEKPFEIKIPPTNDPGV